MQHKNWFITGAGSGLGYCLTKQLLARGANVAATTRKNFTELKALHQRYPEQLWLAPLDVTDHLAISTTIAEAFDYFGHIDVLVNSAGYALLGALEEVSNEQIIDQLQTNLIGAIVVTKSFIPYLRKQGAGQIIHLSSEGGQMAYPALSSYHASKWGLEGFCESLAIELKPFNISVTLIEPGRIQTDFDRNAVMAPVLMPAYQQSTVGNYRRLLAMGKFPINIDLEKIVSAIIEHSNHPLPLRLTFGGRAYANIQKSLNERLKQLQQNEMGARAVDGKD